MRKPPQTDAPASTPLDVQRETLSLLLSREQYEMSPQYPDCMPWNQHLQFLGTITNDANWKRVYADAAKPARDPVEDED